MTKKTNLTNSDKSVKNVPSAKYLTFTDLFKIKQEGLEDLLLKGDKVYLLSKKLPPIKLSFAELS